MVCVGNDRPDSSGGVRTGLWEAQGVAAVWVEEQRNVQACSSKPLPGVSPRWEVSQGWPGERWLQVGLAAGPRSIGSTCV